MFGTSPPVSLVSSAPDEVYHPLDLPPGTVLDRYRLDCAIGRGGMGTVYAAWDLDEERWVAVKVLGGAISDPTLFGRFQREAATVSKLRHPGIVELYHVGQTAQACYIAMRQVQGTTLRGWLNRQPRGAAPPHAEPQPPGSAAPERLKDALRVWRDLVAAVAYAHSVGVAHRDLKPENVMVEPDGRVVVIDFGLARSFTDTTLTTHSGPIGTPMYMAPEQLGGNPAGPASDVYALGLIGYELLSLTLPFRGRTVEALLGEVLHKPIPPLTGRNPAVPPDLANVVHRATAKSPGERYADAGELLADLDRHLAGARVTATGYRYRFNPIEVFAARPRGVSAAVYANFAFGAFFLICTAFLLLSKPMSNDLPEFAGIAAVHLFAGGQMSTGCRWARVGGWCVVCLTLWLIAVSVSREPSALLLALGALFLTVAAANLVALSSPRGREWFALAREKRRAFELERSGAVAPGA
ncbi:serine/threonine-protein kinase [Gemmata sp. JC717]|uniref:Serine/threonine protein kinase n=1 Tax=Gemmata algarum TaxID=2975278 RepID=A0ABU5EVG2_9BACT|nr:serine/threonine-protein kinase [Gemmata algarum]MDY3554818.1 serine/threonine-protein kinase [Gemmata algarum]MDY3558450.1 serine/threonine protein kinase [Gemmata algarum]